MAYPDKLMFWHIMFFTSLFKIVFGLAKALSSQWKSSPVHCHWLLATKLSVNNYSFLRIHMLWFQQISRFISSNWQNCEIKGSKLFTYLFENRAIASISWIVDFLIERSFYDNTSPQTSAEIVIFPLWPVTSRHKSKFIGSSINFNAPLIHPVHQHLPWIFWQNVTRPYSANKNWLETFIKHSQWGLVHMIVMVVADINCIDVRKVRYGARRGWESFWTKSLNRGGSIWKNRV